MIAGELRITIEPDGAIDDGVLIDADGAEAEVVGQATGRAINLRISLDDDEVLVAVGTAENDVRDCKGTMSGPTTNARFPHFAARSGWSVSSS